MTASLQVKSNRYYVVIAYKDDAGKWKHKWVNTQLTVDGNHKREAKKMVEPILREWEPRLTSSSNIQFSDYLRQWLSQVRGSVAASTYAEYKKTVENCICPYFDAKKIALCDLKVFHIEEFYKAKLDGGTSASTIYHYHANINKALKDAVRLEKIPKNPASAVQLPKKEKHTANVYSDTELRMLLDKIKGTNMETVILLAAWFGLRRGEIIGLKWEHIDFSNKTLSVVGVISDKGVGSRTQNLRYVPFPKTDTSSRTFPLDDTMLDYLKGLKQQQEEKQRSAWYDHTWDGFVCVKDFGGIIQPEYVTRNFPKICEECGLKRLKFHELRHTNISLLVNNPAISMKDLQEWAGHSTYKTTADIYSHLQTDSKAKLTASIAGILTETKTNPLETR